LFASVNDRATAAPYDDDMSHTVVAELVAAVMKVEVEVGSWVAADDAVVILESMKMEIPVLAEVAGRVTEVVVAQGDVVNDGDPLVVISG
jgi:acetyl-CoA carboxylase biotin carboxyl carrier protein